MKQTVIDIIVIGDELLAGRTIDLNANFIMKELAMAGYATRSVHIVGDEHSFIVETVQRAAKTADLIIVSGGLGPTSDDITRFAIADAVGVPLVRNERLVAELHRRLQGMSKHLRAITEIEAVIPHKSVPLPNRVGLAPGFRVSLGSCSIMCIPGVPREACAMFASSVMPFIAKTFATEDMLHYHIKTIGIAETRLFSKIKKHIPPSVVLGLYPQGYEVEVQLHAPRARKAIVERCVKKITALLDEYVYSFDTRTFVEVVGVSAQEKNLTIACAESCTAGLIAKRLTDCPGASGFFVGGMVTYSNELKKRLLDVPDALLQTHGAVSQQVARSMVKGLIQWTGADIGVSVTGIAGPGGGSKNKPVGLVYIGVSVQGKVRVKKYTFKGDREKIRWLASQAALYEIWRRLR